MTKVQRYDFNVDDIGIEWYPCTDGDWYQASDVDPLLKQKDDLLRECREALESYLHLDDLNTLRPLYARLNALLEGK